MLLQPRATPIGDEYRLRLSDSAIYHLAMTSDVEAPTFDGHAFTTFPASMMRR